MSVTMQQIDELKDYVRLMTDRGEPPASMEDAVLGFREFRETLAAIRQADAEGAAGLGRPFAEFAREFRAKHGIPSAAE